MISDDGMENLQYHYESDDGSLGANIRLNCMSQRIRQFFHHDHRHHRRLSASGDATTAPVRPKSMLVSLDTRPHTAPGSRRNCGDTKETREGDGVGSIGKAVEVLSADIAMTDAEIKAYLIAQHERNRQLRMRRTRAKVETGVNRSASDSETCPSSVGYESNTSSGGKFAVEAESRREHSNQKSERMTRSSSEKRKGKTETPTLKHKSKFYLERTLCALQKTRTNSADDVVDAEGEEEEEPMTILRPPSPLPHEIHIRRSQIPLSTFRFPSQDTPLSSLHSPLKAHSPTPTPQLAPPKPPQANHKKSSSTSSKLSSYIGTSADLFDATRRDLQSTLRKNAEALSGRLPLDWREKIIDDDSDSDESFYCIGERQEERFAALDAARRLSGRGEDPWTEGTGQACRLCKKASPRGLRGLCSECKEEFRRPRTTILVEGGGQEEARQVRPPLPLKLRSPVNVLSPSSQTKSAGSDLYTKAQVVEFSKASVRPVLVGRNGSVKAVTSSQHISHLTAFHGKELSPEGLTSVQTWQSSKARAVHKTHEETYGQRPPTLLGDETPRSRTPVTSKFSESTNLLTPPTSKSSEGIIFTPTTSKASECDADVGGDEEEVLPQVEKRKWKGKGVDRSESFYSFYDELLKSREAVPPVPSEREWKY